MQFDDRMTRDQTRPEIAGRSDATGADAQDVTPPMRLAPIRHSVGEWRTYLIDLILLILALAAVRFAAVTIWLLPDGDVGEYHRYALAFWTSPPLFHHLPVEYPPLSILPFSLTLLAFGGNYFLVFAICMGLLVVLGYLGFRRYADRRRAIMYGVYLIIGTSGVLLGRFDLVPALATLAALWAAQRARFQLAYLLIAIGILLKLYPIFLLPVIVIAQWQWLARPTNQPTVLATSALRRIVTHQATGAVARSLIPGVAVVALGYLVSFLLNPAGTLSAFHYMSARPIQIESTPASLLWIGTFLHIPARQAYSFLSHNYVGPLDVVLEPLSTVALVAGCLLVYLRQLRGKLTLAQAVTACLCFVIATNKIFSPQYLIWILPFVAMLGEFDLIWISICLLTTLVFPVIYQKDHFYVLSANWRYMAPLALRNGLLVIATIRLTFQQKPHWGASTGGNEE